MRLRLDCPKAAYTADMTIQCSATGELCAHQRWCNGKGWALLTDQAGACPARKDDTSERKAKAAKKRRNKV